MNFFRSDGSQVSRRPNIGFVDQVSLVKRAYILLTDKELESDILPPMLTVKEALLFSARLRLPESVPDSSKIARVFEVMTQLGIDGIADTIIGSNNGEGRGVSGGEMRRVSIGLELVGRPEILILDEPVSWFIGFCLVLNSTLPSIDVRSRLVFGPQSGNCATEPCP